MCEMLPVTSRTHPNSGPWPNRAAHFEGAHFNDCPRCAGIQAQPASWQGGKRPRKARRWRASPNRIISGQVQIGRLCRDLRYRFWRHLVSSGVRCLWRDFGGPVFASKNPVPGG